MAGFDYGRMQLVASRLLMRFNQGVITLTKTTTAPPVDPWTPGAPTATTYTLQATAKGVSKEFVDGTTIVATDVEITAAAFEAEPDPVDVVQLDGRALTVLRLMRLPSAGVLVAWKFVVRG